MYKGYIGNLLSEEVRSVLRFLCAKYVFPTAINRQLTEVYSEKVMREREQHFRKWSRVPKCSKENPR
jgi:hypothetical protein